MNWIEILKVIGISMGALIFLVFFAIACLCGSGDDDPCMMP